jgi:hypothetical protein
MELEERFGAHNYHPLDAVIKREGEHLYGISQHAVIDRDDLRRCLEGSEGCWKIIALTHTRNASSQWQ